MFLIFKKMNELHTHTQQASSPPTHNTQAAAAAAEECRVVFLFLCSVLSLEEETPSLEESHSFIIIIIESFVHLYIFT
jgi:hypothetical protein